MPIEEAQTFLGVDAAASYAEALCKWCPVSLMNIIRDSFSYSH